MTPATTESLMWRGITSPPRGSRKTRCPCCSNTRRKAEEPCLSVYEGAGQVTWFCHHCGWDDFEVIR